MYGLPVSAASWNVELTTDIEGFLGIWRASKDSGVEWYLQGRVTGERVIECLRWTTVASWSMGQGWLCLMLIKQLPLWFCYCQVVKDL